MQTTIERLKETLKPFHGYKWQEFEYHVENADNHVIITAYDSTIRSEGVVCKVYSQFTEIPNYNSSPANIPHKLTVLIAKALRAPTGVYKKPTPKQI